MTDAPRIGLALIARDEADRLPRLLGSVDGAFDYVALVDTGSRDNTVELFREWALAQREKHPGFDSSWAPFTWTDDFAAARRRADELLEGEADWLCWADCDDVLQGAHNLRHVAAEAPAGVAAFIAGYRYATDPQTGECVCYLKRERMVRAGAGVWQGRIHEAQTVQGPCVPLDPSVVEWVHHPAPSDRSERNTRILQAWLDDEPRNPRVLQYLGTEALAAGDLEDAVGLFDRYLAERIGWDEERAQVHRKLAAALQATGDPDRAETVALQAVALLPAFPDSYLTLAEVAYQRGEWVKAGQWAQRVLELGQPDTLLIINPQDYTLNPRVILTGALGQLGQHDQAIHYGEQALQLAPHHPQLARGVAWSRVQQKREQVAHAAVAQAQTLVAHDEQHKALTLLEETVPYFAADHPDVVACRSQLRERLAFLRDPQAYDEHYETGGTQPEDFANTDTREKALAIAGQLPRCDFLLRGLQDLRAGLVAT